MEDRQRPSSLRPVSAISYQSISGQSTEGDEPTPPLPLPRGFSMNGNESIVPSIETTLLQEGDLSDASTARVQPSIPLSRPVSTKLHRSAYIIILVLFYTGLAISAWVITVILSFRPITAKHYGVWIYNREDDGYGWGSAEHIPSLFAKNEQWYRAARVIQSIVGVLTIPLTSAACSRAAVIYSQQSRKLNLRQLIALADKGWTDPATWLRTLFAPQRYGSFCLFGSMAIILLGSVISPLQEVVLSTKTIKIPTRPQMVSNLLDIPDQWADQQNTGVYDPNLVVVKTRNAITSATNIQPQALLWQGAGFTCDVIENLKRGDNGTADGSIPRVCGIGANFGNMSQLVDPFLAQLPSGYSTGLIRQFLPRINSTAKYEVISQDKYPINCQGQPGAFWVEYGNSTDLGKGEIFYYSLSACMPSDQRVSPWKSTRDRQDFYEELYINVTFGQYGFSTLKPSPTGGNLYRVSAHTTAGYFELPNYLNNGIAGHLLDKDPNSLCGMNCEMEGTGGLISEPDI